MIFEKTRSLPGFCMPGGSQHPVCTILMSRRYIKLTSLPGTLYLQTMHPFDRLKFADRVSPPGTSGHATYVR